MAPAPLIHVNAPSDSGDPLIKEAMRAGDSDGAVCVESDERMHWARKKKLKRLVIQRLRYFAIAFAFGSAISAVHGGAVSYENSYDRVQGGQWVNSSMYWEDKLDASGKQFDPIGWHAAHKTLPLGTLIRVSNPKNHRSINVTITDRGPFVPGRDLDLSLGAGTLLGFQGLGMLYMEVLEIPPAKNIQRPVVENLFSSNDVHNTARPAAR
jgi:rare lipoprotein A (RlpA)-like double-psi beta-barrel protein